MQETAASMTNKHPVKHFLPMDRIMHPRFSGKNRKSLHLSAKTGACVLAVCTAFIALAASPCPGAAGPGLKDTIILDIDTTLDSIIFSGFSTALGSQLSSDLTPFGCAVVFSFRHGAPAASGQDSAGIVVSITVRDTNDAAPLLVAKVLTWSAWKNRVSDSGATPIVEMPCPVSDTAAAVMLVAKKIAENLRVRFICRLSVNSVPPHAEVTSATGLNGVCPVDWDVAFGIIDITASRKGYRSRTLRLHLSEARNPDTAQVVLVKRMPYHSAAFVPAVGLGILAAALFGGEYYWYRTYSGLGENDRKNNPEEFDRTFSIAHRFEYGAFTALGCACALFTVTFFW
jgi:hypothetical protein